MFHMGAVRVAPRTANCHWATGTEQLPCWLLSAAAMKKVSPIGEAPSPVGEELEKDLMEGSREPQGSQFKIIGV